MDEQVHTFPIFLRVSLFQPFTYYFWLQAGLFWRRFLLAILRRDKQVCLCSVFSRFHLASYSPTRSGFELGSFDAFFGALLSPLFADILLRDKEVGTLRCFSSYPFCQLLTSLSRTIPVFELGSPGVVLL